MANSSWTPSTLGDEVDLLTGYPFQSKHYTDDPSAVRLLRGDNVVQGRIRWDGVKRWPTDQIDGLSDYTLCPGDVVLAMDRPWIEAGLKYAAISAADTPTLLVQRVSRLRGKQNLDTAFLRYLIGSAEFTHHILAVQTGTAVPHISPTQIKSFPFLRPPLREQRRIADILGSLDDKIDLNRRANETLEALARALFKSWFIDFDPVRAKAAGRKPANLAPATAALFPNEFQDSPLGPIPLGWEVGSILRQADLLSGGTPKTDVPAYWNGTIPWASAKDVSQCGAPFLINTERTITNLGVEESATKIIPALATVVVARGATTGRLAMLAHEMAVNQTCYALRSNVGAPFAVYCHARYFIDRMVHAAHGSVFDTITTSTFDTTNALLAPKELLRAFEANVSPFLQDIRANLQQSHTLARVRDGLLPKLLSGEVAS